MIDKVKPGDAVQIKASTWNGFIDAANFAATAKKIGASAAGNTPGSGIVRIMLQAYNDEQDDIMPQYSGVRLETIIVEPSSLDEFTGTAPVFDARPATTENEDQPFAILLDATRNGDFHFAVLSGITVAPVNISSAEHKYVQPKTDGTGALESCEKSSARILYQAGTSGLQWCVLQLGSASSAKQPHGMWSIELITVDGVQKIKVYNDCAPEGDAGEIIGGTLIFVPQKILDMPPRTGDSWETYVIAVTLTYNENDDAYSVDIVVDTEWNLNSFPIGKGFYPIGEIQTYADPDKPPCLTVANTASALNFEERYYV